MVPRLGQSVTYTFNNVNSNAHHIGNIFSQDIHITASAGAGGTISPSGSTSVNHGENLAFTITPNTGYSITSVAVDGVSQGAISSYTFNNVSANHTISATFTAHVYTISASAGSGGTISPSGNVTVSYGGSQTFVIIPNSGYAISDVLVDGVSQGFVGIYAFGNVTAHHTISARFSQITYTIQASAETGGTISPSGAVTVGQGAQQTFTITANSGYVVSDVLVDGSSIGAVSAYTFTNVSSSHVISARFVQGYTLGVTTTGTGTGSVTPSPTATSYPPGTKVTLRAEKDISSVFAGFSGDCTTTRTSCTIIMNKNAAVTAAFKLKTFKVKTTVVGNGTVSLTEPVSVEDGKATKNETMKKLVNQSKHENNIDYGDQILYTFVPESGNYIKNVTVDGKIHGPVESLTFTDIKRNHRVKVKFESEEKSKLNKNVQLVRHQIFLRDNDGPDEQQNLNDLSDDVDDDDPIEPSLTKHFTSLTK